MVDLKHLRNKTIIVKVAALPRAISGSVINEEPDGLWVAGSDLLVEVTKATSLTSTVRTPAVFVPFAQIQWLMASQD